MKPSGSPQNVLTLIICVRADDFSFYKERLSLRNHLDLQSVHTVIVDDGSSNDVAADIESFCVANEVEYVRLDSTEDEFSLARARNAGIQAARTEWICFEDADLVYSSQHYQKLIANLSILEDGPFNFLTVPVVYLTEDASAPLLSTNLSDEMLSNYISLALLESPSSTSENRIVQTFAPASSVIALSRKTALLAGGFDESFVGWGGEDRDFVFRLLLINKKIQKPQQFENTKPWNLNDTVAFEGWRSLYKLHGDYMARQGVYAFHLYHPPLDWRGPHSSSNLKLAAEKALKHSIAKKLPVLADASIRPDIVIGYNPHLYNEEVLSSLSNPTVLDESGKTDPADYADTIAAKNPNSVVLWNPYGTEWRLKVYKELKARGIDTIVAERGALPNSIYFDRGGLCIESDSYTEAKWARPLNEDEERDVTAYIDDLRYGDRALENQAARIGEGLLRHRLDIPHQSKILLAPLQLSDDTVTTFFSEEGRGYDQYLLEIQRLALSLPADWVLVYKNHPLAVAKSPIQGAICADSYHINDLLQASSAVSVFNSGVGLISMAFYKPVFYYGPCFYAVADLNEKFQDAAHMRSRLAHPLSVDKVKVRQLYHYLTKDFYSFAEWTATIGKSSAISNRSKLTSIHFKEVRIPGCAMKNFEGRNHDLRKTPLFDPFRYYAYVQKKSAAGKGGDLSKTKIAAVANPTRPTPAKKPGPAKASIPTLLAEGYSHFDKQQYREASLVFDAASHVDPHTPTYYRAAAESLDRAGNTSEALVRLKKALAIAQNKRAIARRIREMKRPQWVRSFLPERPFPVGNKGSR